MKESNQFTTFAQKLLEWNSVHNLSGARTIQEVEKNIEDSLYPLQFLPKTPKRALDIGTGAGFPGLILAMAMPQSEWVLVEPRKKRAAFLHYIKTLLQLPNVTIKSSRIEDLEPFKADLITSRAVMKTRDLLQLAKKFMDEESIVLLYKGEDLAKELEGIKEYEIFQRGKRRYLLLKGKDAF